MEADTSINAKRVVGILNEMAWLYGLSEYITIDNGPELISEAMDAWPSIIKNERTAHWGG